MKIQIKKTKTGNLTPWHQDFRNAESLPDIKVIRTQFFINMVAIMLPLVVGIFWLQKEFSLGVLKQDVAKLESEKAAMEPGNNELIALSRDFMKESAKIESLDDYYYNLFPLSDYLLSLSQRVPQDMILTSLGIKKANRVNGNDVIEFWQSEISGYVAQRSRAATATVNSFVEEIAQEELFSQYLEEAFLENLSRDQTTDSLNFVVSISLSDTISSKRGKQQ